MNKLIFLFLILFARSGSSHAQKAANPAEQIPILAWYSIPASETSVERYQEMKEAGITYSLSFFPNLEALQKALDAAVKVGIKMVVSCPELKSDPEKTVKSVMSHPAVAGYHLMDEPGISQFKELGEWGKRIQAVDDKHFCYINLFPNFADSVKQLGTGDYRKYVSECNAKVPLRFLSFDYYPILKDHISKSWYEHLEQFSSESKKAGKSFWAFALTTTYDDNHLTPQTLASMRLQVYSDLAYGAQGIQYFTYWSATSGAPSSEDQRGAPISVAGKRSVVYDRVKQMSEEIKSVSGVFLGAKMVWVRHAGKGMIPAGTVRLTTLPEQIKVLESNGAPILVSLLEKGDHNYLVVVNKDYQNSISLTFLGDDSVRKVMKDGTTVPANAYEASLELDPGDAAIYQFPVKSAKEKKQ